MMLRGVVWQSLKMEIVNDKNTRQIVMTNKLKNHKYTTNDTTIKESSDSLSSLNCGHQIQWTDENKVKK